MLSTAVHVLLINPEDSGCFVGDSDLHAAKCSFSVHDDVGQDVLAFYPHLLASSATAHLNLFIFRLHFYLTKSVWTGKQETGTLLVKYNNHLYSPK